MKKTIIIALAALLALVGCTKQNPVSVSFEKATYVLLSDGTVDVKVVADRASSADLKVDLKFAGSAVKDQDYTVSAESVTIPAGQTSAAVTISAKENFEATNIQLSLVVPAGCAAGANTNATVAVDAKEKIVWSFAASKATVLDFYTLKVELKDMSGKDYVATADMEIPYIASGDVDKAIFEASSFIVAKGTSFGYVVVKPGEDMEIGDAAKVTVTVNEKELGARFVAGDKKEIALDITGLLRLSQIEGTWNFDHIYDVDDLAEFFEMEDDDPSLLPLNNDGFSFTIAKADDGSYDFTSSSTGDFANYFRAAKIDYCAPVNPQLDIFEPLGDYCSVESNMFVAAEDEDLLEMYFTYFSLSNVNRAFSAGSESLGKGAVSFYRIPAGLLVIIRDYDKPEFGDNWWDDDEFDSEMFGFAALFTRAE